MALSKFERQQLSLSAMFKSTLLLGCVGVGCLVAGTRTEMVTAQEPAPATSNATARPALAPSKLPLDFIKGERIAFLGNSQAERMNLFGHFETMLHLQFPDRELVVRNFARPAEEVDAQQRSSDYTAIDDPMKVFGADTYFLFLWFQRILRRC